MRAKICTITLLIVLVIFITGCFKEQTVDEMITEVLTIMYTNEYEDFNNFVDHEIWKKTDENRRKQVKSYFTDEGFESLTRRTQMNDLLSFIYKYNCSSSIDSIELDIRDTDDVSTKVCYYDLILKFDFEEDKLKPLYSEISGSISLYNEDDKWKIGIIIGNRLFNQYLQKQFESHE
jgi:hypothetical protein